MAEKLVRDLFFNIWVIFVGLNFANQVLLHIIEIGVLFSWFKQNCEIHENLTPLNYSAYTAIQSCISCLLMALELTKLNSKIMPCTAICSAISKEAY